MNSPATLARHLLAHQHAAASAAAAAARRGPLVAPALGVMTSRGAAPRRHYTATHATLAPTALARAERASDLKAHPEAAVTQEKLPDQKGNRHWSEENATVSEADVRADREAREEKAKTQQQQQQQDKKA